VVAQRLDELDRRPERLDPGPRELLEKVAVLASAEPVARLRIFAVVRRAFRDVDAARAKKRGDTVATRLPVDVLDVVGDLVERDERLAGPLRTSTEQIVEEPLPRRSVHGRGPRQHAVEIEQ